MTIPTEDTMKHRNPGWLYEEFCESICSNEFYCPDAFHGGHDMFCVLCPSLGHEKLDHSTTGRYPVMGQSEPWEQITFWFALIIVDIVRR